MVSRPLDEPELVARAKRGDVAAYEELVRMHQDIAFRTAYLITRNAADAEEAAQDAFVKCWRRRDQLHRIRNLRAWLFRVGLNAARDLQRNAWRRRIRPLEIVAGTAGTRDSSPAESLESREQDARLRQALMDLRVEEKQIFLLRQNASQLSCKAGQSFLDKRSAASACHFPSCSQPSIKALPRNRASNALLLFLCAKYAFQNAANPGSSRFRRHPAFSLACVIASTRTDGMPQTTALSPSR